MRVKVIVEKKSSMNEIEKEKEKEKGRVNLLVGWLV